MDAKRRARLRQHAQLQSVAKQGAAPRFWLEILAALPQKCDPHEIWRKGSIRYENTKI